MWSLILSEELKLQAFRSNVLKKICGPKKDDLSWKFRIVKSMKLEWVGHVAKIGETRNECRVLVGKSLGKWPLERL